MVNRLLLIGISFYLLFPPVLFAQEATESFVVSVFGGADAVAPTTPTLLTVEPVTPTQINLDWSSSTDNYAVSGYVVERGGTVIATTTQLSYVDSGLSPETIYAYTIRAFDVSLNYSSSSNIVATTTPAVPVISDPAAPESESTEGTAARAVADDVSIATEVTSATFDVLMARPSSLQLRWGRTGSYELGYVVSDVFVREHQIPLTDLSPRTVYEYELVGFTPYGPGVVLERGTFTTEGEVLQFSPQNISRFLVEVEGVDVNLSWELPEQREDIQYVRVLRSHLGFPTHLQDGAVIYQGIDARARVTDEAILSQYSPVYYTAFVVDRYGQVSSGAVAVAFAENTPAGNISTNEGTNTATQPSSLGSGEQTIVQRASSTVNQERVDEFTRLPQLTDITVTQGELVGDPVFTFADESLILETDKPFVISVPKRLVSNNLKSIIASVIDPTDTRRAYSYLLSLNQAGDTYEATVPALYVAGASQITVEVYDYESYVVSSYHTPISLTLPPTAAGVAVFPDLFYPYLPYMFAGLMFLLLLWVLFLWRRQAEDNAY